MSVSASGGAFGALANHVLSNGGVVYGVAYSDEMVAKHIVIEDAESLQKLHDSKYVQSELGNTLENIKKQLQENRKVLFSGTPCQVAGLLKYLKKPYSNLLTCDILCHGVASPKIFAEYVKYIEGKTRKEVTHLSLRDKTNGWDVYTTRIDYKAHSSEINSYWAGIWSRAYPSGLITRPSCHQCHFCSFDRCSDISIGDFWGIEKSHPDCDKKGGVSLLIINTEKGSQVFDKVCEDFYIVESSRAEASQPVLVAPVKPSSGRLQFWTDYQKGGIDYVITKYWGPSLKMRIYNKICSLFTLVRLKK